ncbi:MAG: ATP-binding cassette domain-containing protein [Desulfatirhabdiaceae bacterium]|nr:ATP-binding cassette domain-containing protein [Desulfatirhabdiaceae bacterium]
MIHVENLTRYYDDFCAVDGIHLDIQKGEILGLLGPNGAGKTTTLRMLTGYLQPTAGQVRVKDFTIGPDTLEIKKRIGYLPESAPLYHDMIVYDYLNYVADIRELKDEHKLSRIYELAQLCGLNTVMHKTIGELSKGFKQRVGLAHALMNDPEILVLDEPTSGLDPNQIVEIREIIRKIGREKTIILSTHILSEAEATCDRIAIIHQGKIVADGSTQSIKQSAGKERMLYITLDNADFAAVRQRLEAVEGVVRIDDITPSDATILDIKIFVRSDTDIRKNIYQVIRQADWLLLEFRQETQTLEHIFRELTLEN